MRLKSVILIAILVLGAGLRLYKVDQPFVDIFSWRQASTAMMASNFYSKSWNIFYPEVSWVGARPGYQGREFQTVSYIAALLYAVLGKHDWIGRVVASCFGLWGIFAIYALVRRVWDEHRAVLSAAVLAVMPGAIFIDRSFLPDPAMVALATTSLWMFVAYFQTQARRFLIAGSVVGAWALLSKPGALAVGFPIFYGALASRGSHRLSTRTALRTAMITGLVILPAVLYYAWAIHLGYSYPPYHVAGEENWPWRQGLRQWIHDKYFLPGLIHHWDTWLWTKPVALLVLIGLIGPWFQVWRQSHNHRRRTGESGAGLQWLFHWWFAGFVAFYLIGAQELVASSWNLHILDPAAAALAASAIAQIGSFAGGFVRGRAATFLKPAVIISLLVTILIWGQVRLAPMYRSRAQLGYELGLALREVSAPGDLVVTMPNQLGDPIAIYYSQRRGCAFPLPMTDHLSEDDRESIRMFEQLRNEGARWLGIIAAQRGRLKRNHPLLLSHFERTCRLVRSDRKLFIYSIPPAAP